MLFQLNMIFSTGRYLVLGARRPASANAWLLLVSFFFFDHGGTLSFQAPIFRLKFILGLRVILIFDCALSLRVPRCAIVVFVEVFGNSSSFLLDGWDDCTGPTTHCQEGDFIPIRKQRSLVLLAFAPSMFEKPVFGEFLGICEDIDGSSADIVDCGVELFNLILRQCVAVLFWMNFGVVEDLIARAESETVHIEMQEE